jgi:hypothetical protein
MESPYVPPLFLCIRADEPVCRRGRYRADRFFRDRAEPGHIWRCRVPDLPLRCRVPDFPLRGCASWRPRLSTSTSREFSPGRPATEQLVHAPREGGVPMSKQEEGRRILRSVRHLPIAFIVSEICCAA